jgi:hypothetical protein
MSKELILPKEITDRITLKKVTFGIGHDGAGMHCDIYIDKKKVGFLDDDGWGGEVTIELSKEASKTFKGLLTKHKIKHKMFTEAGWDFYDNEDKICVHSQMESVIDAIVNFGIKSKEMKKIAKKSEREIIVGKWNHYYPLISFKGNKTLREMIAQYGLAKFQDYVNTNVKPKLKEGEQILNTNFEELGLTK